VLIQTGRAAPLPCSGAGRAVLATLSDAAAARIVAEVRLRDRQYTIKPEEVLRDARSARRRGHLITLDLMLPGVGAIGFALPAARTAGQFAIVVAAPSPRIRQRQRDILKVCRPIIDHHLDSVAHSLRRAC
jgi:DNA-binding IclR family transcriptional regulator